MPSTKKQDYDVEKILSKKIDSKGRTLYLIKWKGYSSSENTWEPETNLSNCQETVRAFEAEQTSSSPRSTRSSLQRRSYPVEKSVSSKRARLDVSPSIDNNFKLNQIIDVRRNKKLQTIEYLIEIKNSNKSLWISSKQLINNYSQEIVHFFEENYV